MSEIIGLQGLSKSDGTQKLIAVYGNDFHIWNSTLDNWTGQSIPVTTTNKWRSAVFLDKVFFANGYRITSAGVIAVNDDTLRYDGTTWTNEYVSNKVPLSNYIKPVGDRLYLANLYFKEIDNLNPSRVWFSDLPKNNNITWGFEEGGTLNGTEGDTRVYIQNNIRDRIYFKLRNIKIGDPITLLGISGRTVYNVSSVLSEGALILTEPLETTIDGVDFWVGSNWIDVSPNDGDEITGLGDNNDNLLIFKRDSLHRYNGVSRRKIKGVPGTTSQESVVNIGNYTYYFHRTGIWRTDGVSAELISRSIQDYIDNISPDIYPDVVAWRTGPSQETYRIYVGDITSVDDDISVTNATIDFDTITEQLSIGNLPYAVTTATEFVEGNTRNVYLGTDTGRVYQDNKGNTDDGTAIPFMMDTGFHFPIGPTVEVEFSKVQIFTRSGRGMQIRYKLFGTPWTKDKQWRGSLDDVDDEVTEIKMGGRPEISNIGRGIAFQLTTSATNKRPVIERIEVHWKRSTPRSL